ncbi:MAG: hypothetical protein AAFZ09_06570, partial [Pseudomonadota bacterium]
MAVEGLEQGQRRLPAPVSPGQLQGGAPEAGPVAPARGRQDPATGEVRLQPAAERRAQASIAIPARAIGYADFADNRAGAWPSAFAAPWAVPAILIGAAALVVAGTVRGRRLSGLRAT